MKTLKELIDIYYNPAEHRKYWAGKKDKRDLLQCSSSTMDEFIEWLKLNFTPHPYLFTNSWNVVQGTSGRVLKISRGFNIEINEQYAKNNKRNT